MRSPRACWHVRLDAAVARLRAEGHDLKDEDVACLSPLKDRHINFRGCYLFNIKASGLGQGLRSFRDPAAAEDVTTAGTDCAFGHGPEHSRPLTGGTCGRGRTWADLVAGFAQEPRSGGGVVGAGEELGEALAHLVDREVAVAVAV